MNAPHAWSPQIDIQSVLMREYRKQKPTEVKMDSQSKVSKWYLKVMYGLIWTGEWTTYYLIQSSTAKMTISLTTTVKCKMNFEMFPFDRHICKLEVSFLNSFIIQVLILLQSKIF